MLVKRSLQLQPDAKNSIACRLSAWPNERATSDRDTLLHWQSVCPERSADPADRLGHNFRALQTATKISDAEFHRVASHRRRRSRKRVRSSRWKNDASTASPSVNRRICSKISIGHAAQSPKAELLQINSQNCLRAKVSISSRFSLAIFASDFTRFGRGGDRESIRRFPRTGQRGQHVVRPRWSKAPCWHARNELARAELSLFRPIKCMLATPEPTAETVYERFADAARTRRNGRRPPRVPFIWRTSSTVSGTVAPQCATGRDLLSRFAAYHGAIPGSWRMKPGISRRN